ncbi:MAG: hypothetical protein AAFR69_09955 [Pseudomonadota bacterium]
MASPWNRPKGRVFVASTTDLFEAEGDFLFDPPPLINGTDDRFMRISSTAYAEYGLTDHWQTHFKIAYSTATITTAFSTSQADGLAEIEGGLQRSLRRGATSSLAMAVSVGRQNSLGAGVRPQLASDGIDGELRFLFGKTLRTRKPALFTTAEIAYRRRFGTPADQIRADFKLGIDVNSRVLLLVDAFNTVSLRNETIGGADFDVVKIQPSIVFRVRKSWRLQAGFNAEIAGRNLARGRSVLISLWSEF